MGDQSAAVRLSNWDTGRMPDVIEVDFNNYALLIDGEPFPWLLADDVKVHDAPDECLSVTVTIFASNVVRTGTDAPTTEGRADSP